MRAKNLWNKNAIFTDILQRLGTELSSKAMWEKYLFIVKTTGSHCELAEKAADLLLSDETIINILKELDEFYVEHKRITKN